MGPTFSTILNEFWNDFLQFSAKDGGGGVTPPTPPLMCAPEAWELVKAGSLVAELNTEITN